MKPEAIIPNDEHEDEEYRGSDFEESHEPSFEEPYDWEELMEGVELRRSSRDPDVGLEYLARLEGLEKDEYKEEL